MPSAARASRTPVSSGYAFVISAPERAYQRAPSAPTTASARTPSHLNSNDHPGPTGNSPVVASMGFGTAGIPQP